MPFGHMHNHTHTHCHNYLQIGNENFCCWEFVFIVLPHVCHTCTISSAYNNSHGDIDQIFQSNNLFSTLWSLKKEKERCFWFCVQYIDYTILHNTTHKQCKLAQFEFLPLNRPLSFQQTFQFYFWFCRHDCDFDFLVVLCVFFILGT